LESGDRKGVRSQSKTNPKKKKIQSNGNAPACTGRQIRGKIFVKKKNPLKKNPRTHTKNTAGTNRGQGGGFFSTGGTKRE